MRHAIRKLLARQRRRRSSLEGTPSSQGALALPTHEILRRRSRGMTLLEIMIVLAILALVMGLVVGPKVFKMFNKSKEDIARATVKSYAYDAFPQWSAANPSKACPDDISALGEYMNSTDVKDPWGTPYRMLCGQNLPPGAKGLAVFSAGPDQKDNTSDDIKSWE
jgi:general secretion pathway protein G